ncbi:HD domain-containing protein [Actinoplanes hulinensis]|uniref:HD domain-containing protein n=1 Tax=Actinoplanes hulinensis TaxID=1144547 RepID=A0ABS7B4P1_9ACTN|nr:HD domain-containing protein [Actinoplanes hulinensis]MBW6435754.1 HD domain-containing protein [Actinoplanes hulinensis]
MTPLERAVRGASVPLPELPPEAVRLLVALGAPARLGAHLRAVYAVARDLTGWLEAAYPAVVFDREAVLFGAATHDIGKVLHRAELSVPGTRHEPAGERLLLERGVPPRLARFAGTHGSWHDPRAGVDDRLVSLADKIWKGHRVEDLEQLVVERIADVAGIAVWEAFVSLDDRLQELAAGADDRLAFQNAFPV